MKRMWVFTWVLIGFAGFACSRYNETMLVGKWQGAALQEEGAEIPVQEKQIHLSFFPNGTYSYRSTLNYREAGTYYLDGALLYRRDTLNEASHEMRVKIIRLDEDSLFFRMQENGRERVMQLVRKE
jgi:hypothetical protein